MGELWLKFLNWLVNRQREEGLLFVPQDQRLREVSEALLLEGADPGYINSTTIELWQEERRKRRPRFLSPSQPAIKVKLGKTEGR